MPSGVEHAEFLRIRWVRSHRLIAASMPSGVEHISNEFKPPQHMG